MTNIDVETGLPELPEGQWWSVESLKAVHYDSGYRPYSDPARVRVSIMEHTVVPTVKETYRTTFFGRKVPNGHETVNIEKDVAIASSDVYQEKITPATSVSLETFNRVAPEFVTAADILRTAIQILERRNRELHAASLMGNYPPKKLVVPVTEEA